MNLEIIHQTHVTQKVEEYESDSENFTEGEYEEGRTTGKGGSAGSSEEE